MTIAGVSDLPEAQPRSLIVSYFGSFGRRFGGWIAVADLITLMAEFGIDAPSVRSTVSRLKRRGLLTAVKADGVAGYGLSDDARQILQDGDRRIYGHDRALLADGWVMAVFSVPESQRNKRHLLRSRLSWLGFGVVAPGVWIAPARLADEAARAMRRLGLEPYVDLFAARHLREGDLTAKVARWWDLSVLQDGYESFIAEHRPILQRFDDAGGEVPAGSAFADYVRVVDAWRRMPYLDPGLPAELLPPDWAGTRAAGLFFDLHDRLFEPGAGHVADVIGQRRGPERTGG